MFNARTKTPRFLFSSFLVIALYFSHISFVVLEEMAYWERVAYLKENHFKRVAQREAEMKQFTEMEERDRIGEIIKKYKPNLDTEKVAEITDVICESGTDYNYDPFFLLAVIFTESSLSNGAVSKVGATGLMQIRPFVGKDLAEETNTLWEGQETLFNPIVNVRLGTYYTESGHKLRFCPTRSIGLKSCLSS